MWQIVTLAGLMLVGAGEPAAKKTDVAVVKEWSGTYSLQETAKRVVVKDQKGWEEVWGIMNGRMMPKPEVPKIDFDRQMVVAAFMGSRNSGGFSVKITGIESNGKLTVKVKESSPAKGMAGAAVITQPYHAVVVPKSDKPVEFVDEK